MLCAILSLENTKVYIAKIVTRTFNNREKSIWKWNIIYDNLLHANGNSFQYIDPPSVVINWFFIELARNFGLVEEICILIKLILDFQVYVVNLAPRTTIKDKQDKGNLQVKLVFESLRILLSK